MSDGTPTIASPWLVDRTRDLAFVFGGAALTLAVPLLCAADPRLLPPILWAWVLLVDGPHLWGTYSRTYVDREFRAAHRPLLLGSLVFLVLPLAPALWTSWSGSRTPVDVFLFLAQLWAYYHIVRQHYGFVSLYDRKVGARREAHEASKWPLYVGLWAPFLHFMFHHPVNRHAGGLPPVGAYPAVDLAITGLAVGASLWAAGSLLAYHWRDRGSEGSTSAVSVGFSLVCMLTQSVIFYWVANLEPFFAQPRNLIQTFLVVAIMSSMFHGVQYHLIVWHYHRRRYDTPDAGERFGIAAGLNRSALAYLLCGVVFSIPYGASVWWSTEWPSWTGALWEEEVFVTWAFCLYWGFSLHHYWLDQEIWRPSRSTDLRERLGVAA